MSTKDKIQKEADAAGEKLHEASETVRDQAEHAVDEARRAAQTYADEGKKYAAGNLEDFANAVRRAGDELGEREQTVAARLVNEAADSLSYVAHSIESTSIEDMMDQVNHFARRNPGAFVLGAVLAGVALGRFAKASGERAHGGHGYGEGGHHTERRAYDESRASFGEGRGASAGQSTTGTRTAGAPTPTRTGSGTGTSTGTAAGQGTAGTQGGRGGSVNPRVGPSNPTT